MTSGTDEGGSRASGEPPEDVTLRQVLAFDEGGILRLLVAPTGQDVGVRGVVIGDEHPDVPHEGRIVLAAGLPPAAAIRKAAVRGAAAVVLRAAGAADVPQEVLAAAESAGIALLARAEWADWGDTVTLLRSATAFAAAGSGGPIADAAADGGLAALAAVTAEFCGGSITIEDTRFRVLAHSATGPDADVVRRSTILGGRVPDWRVDELRRSGLLRTLWTSRDVIHRPAAPDAPERLIVAIRSDGEMLGSIWAAADGRGLSPDAARVLRRAADVAAPHLAQHRLRTGGYARREEHALRGLLDGQGDARAHLWSLDLAPDVPCAVVVAERDRPSVPDADRDRTLEILALQAAAHRPSVRVLRERDRLLALMTFEGGGERAAALGLARELDALAASVPWAAPVLIGAGPLVSSPLDAAASCAQAALVVRVLRERQARGREPRPPRHAGAAEVGSALDALRVLDAVRPVWEAGDGPVHRLIRTDLAAGGELVRSLAAYLDAAGDVPRAARDLVLHPNTLRYRLRRARERFGVDLDDPDTRLLLTLAVRLVGAF